MQTRAAPRTTERRSKHVETPPDADQTEGKDGAVAPHSPGRPMRKSICREIVIVASLGAGRTPGQHRRSVSAVVVKAAGRSVRERCRAGTVAAQVLPFPYHSSRCPAHVTDKSSKRFLTIVLLFFAGDGLSPRILAAATWSVVERLTSGFECHVRVRDCSMSRHLGVHRLRSSSVTTSPPAAPLITASRRESVASLWTSLDDPQPRNRAATCSSPEMVTSVVPSRFVGV